MGRNKERNDKKPKLNQGSIWALSGADIHNETTILFTIHFYLLHEIDKPLSKLVDICEGAIKKF